MCAFNLICLDDLCAYMLIESLNYILITQPPPRICYYQELNYTIIVSPLNYSNESDTWFIEFGPFHHRGNGTVKHDITSEKLIANEEYSLQLVLATYFDTVTVGNHYFGEQHSMYTINLVYIKVGSQYYC